MSNTSPKNTFVTEIEQFLQEIVQGLSPEEEKIIGNRTSSRGRPRILPALYLWVGLLVCVLRGMEGQANVWRLLTGGGLWEYPLLKVSDEAVYKRLEKGGTTPIKKLFELISKATKARIEPYYKNSLAPFATNIYAIDVTTLDKITRHLPILRDVPNGDKKLIPGKLAAIYDVCRQQWKHIQYIENPSENDKKSAYSLIEQMEIGSLILTDLGYFSFKWFDTLTEQGYYWVSRLRNKTSYVVTHVYYEDGDTFDGLIWLGKYRSDKAKYMVRLVRYKRGSVIHEYITNQHDPTELSLNQIAQIYARRWDIEMAFKMIKRELGLCRIWSSKQTVVLQQVWAVLAISQIIQAFRMEIAGRANVDPFEISMSLMIEYLPQWGNDTDDPIELFLKHGRRLRFIRPSRRIEINTPDLSKATFTPLPPDLKITRPPRYANKA